MKALIPLIDYTAILSRINESNLSVGNIDFGHREYAFETPVGFIAIGKVECDPLAIEERSGEIVILDHEKQGRVMLRIANNLISLIYALSILETYYEKCRINEALRDNNQFKMKVASDAAAKAGCASFSSFYGNLIGVE